MPTPHKYAALIKQWADDASQPVWYWSPSACRWDRSDFPSWDADLIYAIGDKPTESPRKMCRIAGHQFPMPETVALAVGATYFVPSLTVSHGADYEDYEWCGDAVDSLWLTQGLVHLTKEAAAQHAKALRAASIAAVEAAK